MNDTSSINEPRPEPFDRRAVRQQRREARREFLGAPSTGSALVAGSILILLGAAFLLQNFGAFVIPLQNWWALFFMVPAVGAFDTAWRSYRQENRMTAAARGSLLIGSILTLVTAIYLFQLNWAIFGPVLIILTGLGLLVYQKG
jgi:hypothetical protein